MDNKLHIIIFITIYLISLQTDNATSEEVMSTTHDVTTTTSSPGEPAVAPTPEPDPDHLVNAINEFGFKLVTTMMKQKADQNVVVSPAGIAGLLAMTLLGTVGVSYDELTEALGFSQDILTNRQNHEVLGDLLRALNANGSAAQTSYADAIFVDTRTQIRSVYRDYLKRIYSGETLSAEFNDTSKAKDLINDWVKVNTNGKIEDFLKDPLPSNTNVVLLSALYFKGQWQTPFIPELTRKREFKKGSKMVLREFMLNGGQFNYTFSILNGFHIVALPYKDYATTMYVLMPRFPKSMNITDLMDKIDYMQINDAINTMTEENCLIKFPKMELKSQEDLEKALKALGVKSIFSPKESNFALMVDSDTAPNKTDDELIVRINEGNEEARVLKDILNSLPNPGVYVDSVLHDVKITIDEFGTEAVAASSATLARTVQSFYADSPFYIFIRDEKTKLVTFSAVIMDPADTDDPPSA